MNSKIKTLNERIDDVNALGKELLSERNVYAGDNPTTYQVVEAIEQIPYFEGIEKVEYVKTEDEKDILVVTLPEGKTFEVELEFEGTNIKSFKNGILTWTAEYQDNELVKINDTNIDLERYFSLGYGAAPGEGVDDPESEDYDEDYISNHGKTSEKIGATFYTGPEGGIFKEILAPVGDTIYQPEKNPIPYDGYIFVGWYDYTDSDKEIVQFPEEDIREHKVYIAKYEKKYVDALYQHFQISKEEYPYIGIIISSEDSACLWFSNKEATNSEGELETTRDKIWGVNYALGGTTYYYGPEGIGIQYSWNENFENYFDFEKVYKILTTKTYTQKEWNNINSSSYYDTGTNVDACLAIYTNDLIPEKEELKKKWKQIY